MVWLFLSIFLNAIEQILTGYYVTTVHLVWVIFIFYGMAFIFVSSWKLLQIARKKQSHFIDWKRLSHIKQPLMVALVGCFMGNGLWFFSLIAIGVTATAVLMLFSRVLVMLYAIFVRREQKTKFEYAVILLCFIGLVFFIDPSNQSMSLTGFIIALISATGYAIDNICRKEMANKIDPHDYIIFRQGAQFSFYGLVAIISALFFIDVPPLDFQTDWLSPGLIVVSAFLGGVVVLYCTLRALETIDLVDYETVSSLKPVFIYMMAGLLLGENLTLQQTLSAIVIIASTASLISASRWSKKGAPPKPL